MDIINIGRFLFVLGIMVFFLSLTISHLNYPNKVDQQVMTQRIIILLMHFLGNLILIMNRGIQKTDLIFYMFQVGILLISWALIYLMVPDSHISLWHLVQMLAIIGMIMIMRLDYEQGVKQGKILGVAFLLSILIAFFIKYIKFLSHLTYLYLGMAVGVLLLANTSQGGANNWFALGWLTFQPSELSKLFFLMFLAAFFTKPITHKRLIISAGSTLILLLILVYQRDLGGALIFYMTYITLAFLASNKVKYFMAGLSGGVVGGMVGYQLFSHVKVRVTAWLHPFDFIDDQGYQITQSLFAISAGGWFGTGLTRGMPLRIPVVISDFIYAAIAEEFGNIFSIIILLLFVLLFVMISKIAFPITQLFDTILIFGIGIMLTFQTFLIVGGVIKFIPSTGVTLPLISYGGTSLLVVMMMIGMIQGLSVKYRETQEDQNGEEE